MNNLIYIWYPSYRPPFLESKVTFYAKYTNKFSRLFPEGLENTQMLKQDKVGGSAIFLFSYELNCTVH